MSIQSQDYRHRFEQSLNHLQQEFSALRTGRASVQLLDSVRVDAYASMMILSEVANVSAPDSQLIVVKPWDKNLLGAIEKGIQIAQLNLNPIVDKELVRIPVPPLTTERRQEMVKVLHQKAEEGRVMLRQVRADIHRDIEKQEGTPGVSEDDIIAESKELDEVVKEYMLRVDELVKAKEKDLLRI